MSNSYSCLALLNINSKGEHFAKLRWQEVRGTDTKERDFFMFLRDNNRENVQVKNCGRTLAMRATHASDHHIQRCSCGSHVVLEYFFSSKMPGGASDNFIINLLSKEFHFWTSCLCRLYSTTQFENLGQGTKKREKKTTKQTARPPNNFVNVPF